MRHALAPTSYCGRSCLDRCLLLLRRFHITWLMYHTLFPYTYHFSGAWKPWLWWAIAVSSVESARFCVGKYTKNAFPQNLLFAHVSTQCAQHNVSFVNREHGSCLDFHRNSISPLWVNVWNRIYATFQAEVLLFQISSKLQSKNESFSGDCHQEFCWANWREIPRNQFLHFAIILCIPSPLLSVASRVSGINIENETTKFVSNEFMTQTHYHRYIVCDQRTNAEKLYRSQ